jgi:glucose/mannose-6-phosphate isomerase
METGRPIRSGFDGAILKNTKNTPMNHPVDTSNFRQMLLAGPDQFRIGMDLARNVRVEGDFEAVEISGMGGSALPANFLRVYLSDLSRRFKMERRVAIFQNRFYDLPHEAYDKCLNIICSYSGNTEETVASFEQALRHGLPCVGISAGGRIEEMCRENGVPHVKLPIPFDNFQPRIGTGYFFGAIFRIFVNAGLTPDASSEVAEAADRMKERMAAWEKRGKALAKRLAKKTPVVYASPRYKSVAMVWKIKINENAKTPAFWNFFPELNHNEMVGFTNPQAPFFVVMLRDPQDHPRNFRRFEMTAGLLKEKGIESEIIDMEGDDVFTKMFSTTCLGDWASYYLALEYGQDPTPVDMVEDLKKLLV